MDDYEPFCLVDAVFYDTPATITSTGTDLGSALLADLPDGWSISAMDIWTVVHCHRSPLPLQGWKIHVSATPANAPAVLERTWVHCVPHGLSFKFLRNATTVLAQNTKYADRRSSGKFITIYPRDEVELARTLAELGAALDGFEGPYILSDLRWGAGPLYVRYGGFVERQCRTETGELESAIEAPDGRLVPDVRQPVFRTPDWVEVPPFLATQIERARASAGDGIPYRVREALHFSNGGGVYLAEDPSTDRSVVLKEARPLAGLDREGADAVARLHRERAILERLEGLDCVPRLYECRQWWEHHFLVEEHVAGETLSDEVVARLPLLFPDPSPERLAEYTAWALAVLDDLAAALQSVHDRGVVFGDLHPRNVIVRPDGRVALVDFELSGLGEDDWTPSLGAPGFLAPPDRHGFAVDRYALACIRLATFLPLTQLLTFDPTKLDELLGEIERRFPVPASFAETVRRELGAPASSPAVDRRVRSRVWPVHTVPEWEPVRASIARAIVASATPDRVDRLYPGDPAQFLHGGTGFAYGAAGVLWALAQTGSPAPPAHVDWLVRATDETAQPSPGFYDGLHGIAYALDAVGRPADACRVLDEALRLPLDPADLSLFSGIAGVGLNLLHFATRTDTGAATRLADLATRLGGVAVDAVMAADGRRPRPGLLHGWTGAALFLMRLHERAPDDELLAAATRALRLDLDACTWTEDGTLQVDDGWRVLPYLNIGSAGMGIVATELLDHVTDDGWLRRAVRGIRRAAIADFVIQAGLFNGRAGLMLALATATPSDRAEARRQAAMLAWHAVAHEGELAFVGDQLMRLSMDFATGSAGILLALGAVLGPAPLSLPFLRPASPTGTRPPGCGNGGADAIPGRGRR